MKKITLLTASLLVLLVALGACSTTPTDDNEAMDNTPKAPTPEAGDDVTPPVPPNVDEVMIDDTPTDENTPDQMTTDGSTGDDGSMQQDNGETMAGNTYSAAVVATHDSSNSCWTIIREKVYDVTEWIPLHPGGPEAILQLCGGDGSSLFVNQHGGWDQAENKLAEMYVGDLA